MPVLSVADRVTWTAASYQPVEQALLLHLIVVVGRLPSICTVCDLTASALPELSTEKYFTVEVLETVNGPGVGRARRRRRAAVGGVVGLVDAGPAGVAGRRESHLDGW
jgi:hypothetical protein